MLSDINEVTAHIHYSENDINKSFPTLVMQGAFGVSGFDIDPHTGQMKSCCVCFARSDDECCCNYVPPDAS